MFILLFAFIYYPLSPSNIKIIPTRATIAETEIEIPNALLIALFNLFLYLIVNIKTFVSVNNNPIINNVPPIA
nr:hypothetical protein [Mycoplasmopsis bovis]